jgi:hypothetical protein
MSALGQKQTSTHVHVMSALPPKADIETQSRDVRFVPKADVSSRSKTARYSITLSAVTSNLSGILSPSALAVFRFITNSNFVAC